MTKGRRALTFEVIDALCESTLGACALRVAMAIGRFQGGNDWAWCSVGAIRERVGGVDRRTVQRAITELRESGYLTIEEQRGKGSRYQLKTPDGYAARGDHATGGADAAGDEDDGAALTPHAARGVDAAPPAAPAPPAGGVSIPRHLSLEETDQGSAYAHVPDWSVEKFDRSRAGDIGRLADHVQRAVGDAQVRHGGARTPSDTSSRWMRLAEWCVETSREPVRPMPLADVIEQLSEGWASDVWVKRAGYPVKALIDNPQKYFTARVGGMAPVSRRFLDNPEKLAARELREPDDERELDALLAEGGP